MRFKNIVGTLKTLCFGVAVALFIVKFIGFLSIVSQSSMQNMLFDGDILWVEKVSTFTNTLKRGDIITLTPSVFASENSKYSIVKRIIAIENDHVSIKNGRVFVNGVAIKENYIKGISTTSPASNANNNITISHGNVYILGDNRSIPIYDSRNLGQISTKDITGRVLFRFYPLNKIGLLVKT